MGDLDLKKRIESNNSRGTAQPYLLLLQERRTYVAHDEYNSSTDTRFVEHLTGDCLQANTKDELVQALTESGYDKKEIQESIIEFQEGEYWETTNVFLTDKGYEDHLRRNAHNIGRHRTYGIHAFRNDEIKKVYEIIEDDLIKDQRIQQLEDALKDMSEALVKFEQIRRLDGNGNEFEGYECLLARKTLQKHSELLTKINEEKKG